MSAAALYEYLGVHDKPQVVLCESDKEAEEARAVGALLKIDTVVLPDFRAQFDDDLRSWSEELHSLIGALRFAARHPGAMLIAPFRSLRYPLPKPQLLQTMRIDFGDNLDLGALRTRLFHWGYVFVDVVQAEGEASIRGDIIDLFVPGSPMPNRLSLFDEQIESIRVFDPQSQKSDPSELEGIEIAPALFSLDAAQYRVLETRTHRSGSDAFVKDMASLSLWYLGDLGEDWLAGKTALWMRTSLQEVEAALAESKNALSGERFEHPVVPESKTVKPILPINADALREAHPQKRLVLVAEHESAVRRSGIAELKGAEVIRDRGLVSLLTSDALVISLNKPSVRRKTGRKQVLLLDELSRGDYVVHETYGVGIFEGITVHEIMGAKRDFVQIRYQNDDHLLLPVENLDLIDRYIAQGGTLPIVDRLGKGSFLRLKAKAREKLFAIAEQIVSLSAKRLLLQGARVEADIPEIALLRQSAGFDYTEDQNRAIEEIFKDLSGGQVMDRLLSGDVGFGKTEVALNAITTVVKSGRQCAFVVPTTLLSAQHYKTLKERLVPLGIRIGRLDRFVASKEKQRLMQASSAGELDVLVGTHALLQAKFAALGLVIIDEEHKFGVKQKEALKALASNVHLLSMSATPIPRSLNMALGKIKGYSQLQSAPQDRKGVRTFVKNFDLSLIKEAVMRELRRGGQLFYIYNSIASIEEKREQLQELMPKLRILVLHSKVSAVTTEKEMLRFEAGEYDLLLSTTIVESGIHLPNVNTMIIDGAENFGIADLHQLRGRVGRSSKEGYCYYLVEEKEALSDQARQRLIALESHSTLGSGAVLAYHDLQIRGGGNLIGESQSGHIKQIGYALYLKLLEEAIRTFSHERSEQSGSCDIKLSISAYISPELVPQERVRLELYRRLSAVKSVPDVHEIETEIEDRFGKPDKPSLRFLDLVIMKILAAKSKIERISNYNQSISFVYQNETKETIKADSRDEDDIADAVLTYLRKKEKENA